MDTFRNQDQVKNANSAIIFIRVVRLVRVVQVVPVVQVVQVVQVVSLDDMHSENIWWLRYFASTGVLFFTAKQVPISSLLIIWQLSY